MQRVVEAFAVVFLLVVGVIGGYLFWTRSGTTPDPIEQIKREHEQRQQQVAAARAAATSPFPAIPAVHHTGDPLILFKPVVAPQPPATALPSGVQVRHLNTQAQKFRISPDGHWGMSFESGQGRDLRGAVWNLDTGKLQRFLSAELDKGTTPYAGRDEANFGASVELPSLMLLAFSPNGQRFAAMHSKLQGEDIPVLFVWDVASGKLLCRYEEPTASGTVFLWPNDDTLIFQAEGALIRLNVDTLEADLLRPATFSNYISWCGVAGDRLLIASSEAMATLSLTTKQYRRFPEPPSNLPSPANLSADGKDQAALLQALQRTMNAERNNKSTLLHAQVAISADGKQLVAWRQIGDPDVWDLDTMQPRERAPQEGKERVHRSFLGEAVMGLQPVHGPNSVQFLEVASDQVVTTLRVPFRATKLQGISANATRLVIPTDQQTSLVVDLPEGLPPGTFDLADAIGDNKLPSTR
jgi:hypothetical protein